MARRAARATKRTLGGFSVERMPVAASWVVRLMPGAELKPQAYSSGYIIVPWQEANLIRVMRKGKRVVAEAPVAHKVSEPFWVDPPPKGHTYTLRNVGGSVSLFQKIVVIGQPGVTKAQRKLSTEKLVIHCGRHKHTFHVEMATTIREWEVGLSFREKIKRDGGMLFDWNGVHRHRMQTRLMEVPVDIVFIDARGRIVFIAADQQPGWLLPVDSGSPSRAVLELAGGTMARIGAKVRDRVEQRIFN